MSAGGKRKGAGRKPLLLDQKAVGVTVRVRPAIALRFAAWCTLRGVSQSRAFSAWVKRSARDPVDAVHPISRECGESGSDCNRYTSPVGESNTGTISSPNTTMSRTAAEKGQPQ